MSKAVKSVARAVTNVVKGAVKLVKKVATSKIGKLVAGAALVYFGVPAAQGFMSGGLSGAVSGIQGAWSGLTGAASSAMAGNFAEAGTKLATGFNSGSGIISGSMNPTASAGLDASAAGSTSPFANATAELGSGASAFPGGAGSATFDSSAYGNYGAAANPPAKSAFSLANFMDSKGGAAAITAGGQLIAGIGNGITAQTQQDNLERMDAEKRARYETNNGTRLWK